MRLSYRVAAPSTLHTRPDPVRHPTEPRSSHRDVGADNRRCHPTPVDTGPLVWHDHATFCSIPSMSRTRISTTVDADRLERSRALLQLPDSQLLDRALEALLAAHDARRERDALTRLPYEDDAEVSWTAPDGPPLAYDGDVPEDVRRLAAERRAAYDR